MSAKLSKVKIMQFAESCRMQIDIGLRLIKRMFGRSFSLVSDTENYSKIQMQTIASGYAPTVESAALSCVPHNLVHKFVFVLRFFCNVLLPGQPGVEAIGY